MADKDEPVWWSSLETQASAAFDFWHAFLDLRRDPSNKVLGASDIAALRRIIRAVSWVESKHGHGGGSSKVDPMQCGNPADAWWKTLTGQSGNGDRFVRGPNQTPNYYAKELPAAAAADGAFPSAAKLASLTKPTDGHSDAKYSSLMSFYWGVPYLLHRTNTGAGAKTFQCGDCSEKRLVDGAVAYNGGGDPNYRKKIEAALDLIDHPLVVVPLTVAPPQAQPVEVFSNILTALLDSVTTAGGHLLFPNGITNLTFEVDLASSRLKFEVKGPSQPPDSAAE